MNDGWRWRRERGDGGLGSLRHTDEIGSREKNSIDWEYCWWWIVGERRA